MRKQAKVALPATVEQIETIAGSCDALKAAGITTFEEARIYLAVARKPAASVTLSNVAVECRMPMSTLSRIAFGLEQRGLLAYHQHPSDRRKKMLVANTTALVA